MHKVFAASPWWVLALIQRVPISFKFNCTSKKMLSLRQYEGAHVYHYMKDQSVSRRDSSQHFFFPPCHTYSVAVTSSAIKKKRQSHKQRYIIYHHDRHPQLFLTLKFAVETLTRTVTVTLHYCKLV